MTGVAPGDILDGKYRVTKVLGTGGMGVVVAATHIVLDEPVAIKYMLPEVVDDEEGVARFMREARATVKLQSEHVARVRDVGKLENGAPYIVMEFLEGTDLAAVLARRGPLPVEAAVEYIIQACDAIAEAHSMGVIHRDIKPANLFLTQRKDRTPRVKVLDFGISKASPSALNSDSLTKTRSVLGSPIYMSPEQMISAKDTDARTDVWALGIVLYELLGGRPPFIAETLGGVMSLVLTVTAPLVSTVRADVPVGLAEVIARCLERDRNVRWPSVAHLTAALAQYAPPRARPLIDRIGVVQGLGRVVDTGTVTRVLPPSVPPPAAAVPAPASTVPAPAAVPSVPAPSVPPTAMPPGTRMKDDVTATAGWGATGRSTREVSGMSGRAKAIVTVAMLAVLGGSGFLVLHRPAWRSAASSVSRRVFARASSAVARPPAPAPPPPEPATALPAPPPPPIATADASTGAAAAPPGTGSASAPAPSKPPGP